MRSGKQPLLQTHLNITKSGFSEYDSEFSSSLSNDES